MQENRPNTPQPPNSPLPTSAPTTTSSSSVKEKKSIGKAGGREGNLNYSPAEDLQLCKSWLKISINAETGTDQDGGQFWQKVATHFASHIEDPRGERTAKALMSRWSRNIQKEVAKFCGHYAQIKGLKQSGQNELGLRTQAKEAYFRFEKKQFAFELCWETLRSFDKWNDKLEEMKAKKNTPADNNKKGKGKAPAVSNVGQEGDNGESSTAQSTNKRPDGNKKEKARTELKRDFDEAMKNQAAFLEETRKKSRYLEQLVAVEKRKAKDDRKERDEKIMAVDPSQLDPVRRQFFEIRQKQILERLLAGGAEDEEDEEDDGEEDEKFEEENEEVEEVEAVEPSGDEHDVVE